MSGVEVKSMNKDQLKAHVAKNFPSVVLNMSDRLDVIRNRVMNLESEVAEKEEEAKTTVEKVSVSAAPSVKGSWVQNPTSGLAFHVNDPVAKAHPEWKPCSREGKLIG